MRILHVTKTYLPQSQTFVINTLVLLKQLGAENLLLTGSLDKIPDSSIQSYLTLFQFPNFLRRSAFVHKVVARAEKYLIKVGENRIRNFIKSMKINVLHFHFGWSYELFAKAVDNSTTPIVISFHGSDVSLHPKRSRNYQEMIINLSKKNNVLFTTPSQYLKNELLEWGIAENKIVVLYNTFNSALFPQMQKRIDFNPSYLRVINVSRMISWKGQNYLIEAFAEFLKHKQGHLTLVGGGDELPRMKELADKLGIYKNVKFMGELSQIEVKELMFEHDVYVQPSTIDTNSNQCETFGVVLLEAMASGLIVVATNTGGMPEVLKSDLFENQFYFLVNQKDSSEIAEVLKSVTSKDFIYKPNNEYASERLSKFSNDNYKAVLKETYGKLLTW